MLNRLQLLAVDRARQHVKRQGSRAIRFNRARTEPIAAGVILAIPHLDGRALVWVGLDVPMNI